MKSPAVPRSAPLRLSDEDFVATLPQSPARARKSIEGRLFSWGAQVASRLSERIGAVEVHAVRDPEGDGSGVVFVRERFARKTLEELAEGTRTLRPRMGEAPYLPHLHVALVVYFEAIELRVEVFARAWVDLENLRARLADPTALLELTSALELLPEAFEISAPGMPAVPAHRATAEDLRAVCERARVEQSAFRIRFRIAKADVVSFKDDIGEALEDAVTAISSVGKLVAWADDNDVLGLLARFEARRERHAKDEPEDDTSPVPSERPARRPPRDDEPRTRRERPSLVPKASAAEPERVYSAPPARIERRIPRRPPRMLDTDPTAPVERGARVHVLSGPFSGREGHVVDLSATGEAKVSMGLLVTRVPVSELVVCAPKGKRRTTLPSSHRKLGPR
ncbi:MAG: hypothetical protein U0183_28980 [Polyangiaceae bacterium]